uniref:Uncharacterized protein n=1 Tax=Oryza meridionalis TaxID=40149 RepID=A0A0E0CHN7_9ORYZ
MVKAAVVAATAVADGSGVGDGGSEVNGSGGGTPGSGGGATSGGGWSMRCRRPTSPVSAGDGGERRTADLGFPRSRSGAFLVGVEGWCIIWSLCRYPSVCTRHLEASVLDALVDRVSEVKTLLRF